MAGFRVYSFNWSDFADLTAQSHTELHKRFAALLSTASMRKRLELPPSFPGTVDDLTETVQKLFRAPSWYVGQSPEQSALRHKLLFAMFFDEELRGLGLTATPAWREFCENCSSDIGAVLAGRMVLDHNRIKPGGEAYFKVVARATPAENPYWWFGNRPYRHTNWQGSNADMMEFEEAYGRVVYSIHSPEEVELLANELDRWTDEVNASGCDELREMFDDYRYCVGGVNQSQAGMLVESDY